MLRKNVMTEKNKEIISEFVNELTNNHNSKAWEMYCDLGFVHHFDIPNIPNGLEGAKLLSEQIIEAFPDVSVKINLLLAENDWVVEQATAKATHLGNFMGISPTAKSVSWEETHCYRLANGKIVEHYPSIRFYKIMHELLEK
nr:ester cyclase [Cytophagales bacterium]